MNCSWHCLLQWCAIKHLNGVLKRHFAYLNYLRVEPQGACNIILVCIILHNIATRRHVPLCDDVNDAPEPVEEPDQPLAFSQIEGLTGRVVRDATIFIFDRFISDDCFFEINIQWWMTEKLNILFLFVIEICFICFCLNPIRSSLNNWPPAIKVTRVTQHIFSSMFGLSWYILVSSFFVTENKHVFCHSFGRSMKDLFLAHQVL